MDTTNHEILEVNISEPNMMLGYIYIYIYYYAELYCVSENLAPKHTLKISRIKTQ